MSKNKILTVDLTMFDGSGDANGSSAVAGQGNSGDANGTNPAAEGKETANNAANDRENKEQAFKALITGEYKDEYAKESQKVIDKRFKQTKQLESQLDSLQPFLNKLHARYRTNGDVQKMIAAFDKDDFFWGGVAEERGGTNDDARRTIEMEAELSAYRQQDQMKKWQAEIAAVQEEYPDFDIDSEMADPVFRSLLATGAPLKDVYEQRHMKEFISRAVQKAVVDTERKVTETIRAKGGRPEENGMQQGASYTTAIDVSKLTREDRKAILEKVRRGEHVELV